MNEIENFAGLNHAGALVITFGSTNAPIIVAMNETNITTAKIVNGALVDIAFLKNVRQSVKGVKFISKLFV